MQTWQISQLIQHPQWCTQSADHEHELTKSCRMSQNCDKLKVQLKTKCIAKLAGRCIKIGSNDVMTSRSVMYKKPQNTTFQCRAPIIKHLMQIEESRPVFAPYQTFWEPHLPPLQQNCLITVYYLRQCFRCCLSQLSVWLLATLHKNFQTDLHETFSKGWQWANE